MSAKSLVPAEGIEPPTFGLQNRCSTAELSRRRLESGQGSAMRRVCPRARRNIRLGWKVPEPAKIVAGMKQAARRPPVLICSTYATLLADVLAAVVALDPGAGPTNDAVASRVGIPIAIPTLFAAVVAAVAAGIVIGVRVVPAAERR
jgi:hypothetical protein